MGISIWQLLIVLVIVLLLFGTKKIRSLGGDLGASIRSFRKAVRDGEESGAGGKEEEQAEGAVIEGEVADKDAAEPAKEKDRAS